MPDETVQTAEPSPAPEVSETPAVAEVSLTDRYNKWSGEEQRNYDLTGQEPARKSAEPAKGANEPESAPGTQEPKKLSDEERSQRDREKSQRRQAAFWQPKLTAAEERAAKAERELAELKGKKTEAAPVSAKPAVSVEGKPVRPKLADYAEKPIEEWEAAQEAYEDKLADWKLAQHQKQLSAADEARERQIAEAEASAQLSEHFDGFQAKVKEYIGSDKERETAYNAARDEVSDFFKNLPEKHPLGNLEALIIESQMPELVIHFATHPDEFERMVKRPTMTAVYAEFGEIKATVKASLKQAPQPSKFSRAPEPPVKLGGANERVAGPKVGSQAWVDAENAKDVARLLGK